MYERFFHLRERPFALSPDPDYLYPSRVHREALGYLRYGIESQAGFVVITGEIGSGKTTLLQTLLRNLDGQTTVVRLMNTLLDPRELLEAVALDLGVAVDNTSKPVLLHALAARLVEERRAGRVVLVVIDEAQNLSLPTLEELRMLSNLETEKSKLVQVILVGQPDLRTHLDQPALVQLRQRITVSYHLGALDAEETAAYINHRLRRASVGPPLQLSSDVTDVVHERSRGVPRLINVICDAALVFAYADERRHLDRGAIGEALAELEATGVLRRDDPADRDEPGRRPHAGGTFLPAGRTDTFEEAAAVEARASAMAAQEAAVRAREERVARAEEQLAEQRRVLTEELRLLRPRHADDPAPAGPRRDVRDDTAGAWPPAGAAGPASGDAVSNGRAAETVSPVREQVLLFTSPPWIEEPPRWNLWRRVRTFLRGTARVAP